MNRWADKRNTDLAKNKGINNLNAQSDHAKRRFWLSWGTRNRNSFCSGFSIWRLVADGINWLSLSQWSKEQHVALLIPKTHILACPWFTRTVRYILAWCNSWWSYWPQLDVIILKPTLHPTVSVVWCNWMFLDGTVHSSRNRYSSVSGNRCSLRGNCDWHFITSASGVHVSLKIGYLRHSVKVKLSLCLF